MTMSDRWRHHARERLDKAAATDSEDERLALAAEAEMWIRSGLQVEAAGLVPEAEVTWPSGAPSPWSS